jgi:hypothetical protein
MLITIFHESFVMGSSAFQMSRQTAVLSERSGSSYRRRRNKQPLHSRQRDQFYLQPRFNKIDKRKHFQRDPGAEKFRIQAAVSKLAAVIHLAGTVAAAGQPG